ncbi:MAG: lysophospholipid acyltransferase family protein [Victivallaceae bacterium]
MSEKLKKKKKVKGVFRIWSEFIPFWLFYKFVRLLPLKVGYAISRQVFKGFFSIDRKHRERTIKHLIHAGVAKDEVEGRAMAFKSFMSFSMLLVEIFKMDQEFSVDKMSVSGSESTIKEALSRDGGNCNVIIVTAHYGNWEVAGTAWATYTGIPMVSVMRPFGNPLIGEYILRSRTSDIHKMVNKSGGIRGLLKALKEKKTIAILADQHAGSNEGMETVFFGQPCRTHTSPALLHLKTGVPIVPMLTRRLDDNFHFEFVVSDLIKYEPTDDKEKDILTVTQMYTTALEKMISQQPEQWLWAHRRWLNIHRKPAVAAPVVSE